MLTTRRILKKLRKISNPVSSSLTNLVYKVTGQRLGQKRKFDISTHRNPYTFELAASETDIFFTADEGDSCSKKVWTKKVATEKAIQTKGNGLVI